MTIGLQETPQERTHVVVADAAVPARGAGPVRFGLSLRLLALTVVFVMIAEVLIYVPSIANFRKNWLQDRIGAAQIAALVLDAAPAGMVPPDLEHKLVMQVGAATVAVRSGGARRLLAVADMPPSVDREVDLRAATPWSQIADAFECLLQGGSRYIRVVGPGMDGVEFVEIVLDEAPLREAMLRFSINILVLSLIISGITAVLVYAALHRMIVRPVRRLTTSIVAFEAELENSSLMVSPSGRRDEIGVAEEALGAMQRTLADELRQKKHLANLGLAVSKVNHDLRNMLASAQLFSDRLSGLNDPTAQRFAPKLIAALDRAITFCQTTLDYGRAAEPAPRRRRIKLAPLVEDLRDALGLWDGEAMTLLSAVPADIEVDADPEQLTRVLVNLGRNAAQAMIQAQVPGPVLRVSARREGARVVIEVSDNGPGIPHALRERLFKAFQTSGRRGGTGLGLAIAAELVEAHGGSITVDDANPGAIFRIQLPDRARG